MKTVSISLQLKWTKFDRIIDNIRGSVLCFQFNISMIQLSSFRLNSGVPNLGTKTCMYTELCFSRNMLVCV